MKITISKEEFTDALKKLQMAVATKSQTPILSGIYFSASESKLEMQATDHTTGIIAKIPANVEESGETVISGKKLFEIVLKLSGETLTLAATNTHRLAIAYDRLSEMIDDFERLVPAKSLWQISTMLEEGQIKISFSDKSANFIFDNWLVTMRLISGNFPNFNNLLDEEKNIFVTVNPNDFLQALNRVSIVAKEADYEAVKLDIANNEIKISSSSADVGKAEEVVPAEIEGSELQIFFHYKYLTDVLKVCGTEKIKIGMSGTLKPIDFQLDDFRYIVTPIRRN